MALARPAFAAAASFSVAPPPSWIAPVDPVDDDGSGEASNGRQYLLYDTEVRLGDGRQETYRRFVERITNESGLQAGSQIDVDFDPSFQTLTFHSVVVRRGSEVLDRFDRGAVRLAQREPNLEAQVYDGRVSAVLFIEDLRVGDVVEYSYSIRGADPTLQGRYADLLLLGAPEAFGRVRARVLIPSARHLRFAALGPPGGPVPVIRSLGDYIEYSWDSSHVKAYVDEADAPTWYVPFPFVQLSEFTTWQEVAAVGSRLFDAEAPRSGALYDWVRRARSEAASTDEFVLRAMHFVQDEVRYVAIEVGMSRRRPTAPTTVFGRRYGDCKDKAALLVAMLRAGGVDARPALVSSTRGRTLDEWTPSMTAFDHAIVEVTTPSKGKYWIDPTLILQGGGTERLKYATFERALELDARTEGLEAMAPEPAVDPSPIVHDVFNVAEPATDEETRLDSEHVYRGATADAIRVALRTRTYEQLRKEFLQLYQDDYPGIRDAGGLEVSDDRRSDAVRVVAHFAIPHFWAAPESDQTYRAQVAARAFERDLKRPSIAGRRAPLGIPYPLRVRYEAVLVLPYDMSVTPDRREVEGPAFHFTVTSAYERRRLTYTFELATTAAEVGLGELGAHDVAVDQARRLLARALTYRPPVPDGPNWLFIGILAAVLPGLGWGAHRAYRYNPAPRRAPEVVPMLEIGGWLKLLGLGIFIGPFLMLWRTRSAARVLFSVAAWTTLTRHGLGGQPPSIAPIIVFELFGQLALTAYGVALIPIFLGRRRSFPFHFTAYAVGSVGFQLIDVVWAGATMTAHDSTKGVAAIVRTLVWATLWIAYLRTSDRARATFVE